jgi:hypothetical protein
VCVCVLYFLFSVVCGYVRVHGTLLSLASWRIHSSDVGIISSKSWSIHYFIILIIFEIFKIKFIFFCYSCLFVLIISSTTLPLSIETVDQL